MRRFLLLSAVALIAIGSVFYCAGSNAQQPAPPDPRIDGYRQLLAEANDRVVSLIGQASALQAQVTALTKQIEDAKKASEEKPK